MHSCINVHFEDYGLAVTDMETTLNNLNKAGITKVAATGYGNFTQYEELQELIELKKKNDPNFRVDAYPAVTIYFENPNQQLTLIAKNKRGYKSLCKIITDSNKLGTIIENRDNKSANIPIVSLENLKKNVSKGDLILTTGGRSGVFFQKMFEHNYAIENKIKNLEEQLNFDFEFEGKIIHLNYEKAYAILQQYQKNISVKKVTKNELKLAKNDPELYDALLKDRDIYEKSLAYKKAYAPKIEALTKALKPYDKLYREYCDAKSSIQEIDYSELTDLVVDLDEIFGEENVYFEIQNHGLEIEKKGYEELFKWLGNIYKNRLIVGNETRIGLTSDATPEELEKELLKLDISKFNRLKEYTPREENIEEFNIKTESELRQLLKEYTFLSEDDINHAIYNSDKVMDSCNFTKSTEKTNHYPKFCDDENEEFERLCKEGIKKRFPNASDWTEEYEKRFQYELNIIKTMGYAGYHLIVNDYLQYGRLLGYLDKNEVENAPWTIEELDQYLKDTNNPRIGMGIGPGRGSAAGSLCCYLIGITDLDPIKYNLMFERFLNIERVSMPDIDSDFRPEIRIKCRDYVRHKYGASNTCEIVTKSYMHSKGAIRDTARFLIAKESVNATAEQKLQIKSIYETLATYFSKQINRFDRLGKMSVSELVEKLNEENYQFTDNETKLLNMAIQVEDTFNGYGQHAAGTIIANCDISDEMPLMWNSSSESLEIQCQNAQSEAKGFLKMDFLGLENLSIISDVEQKSETRNDFYEIIQNSFQRDAILNDSKVYSHIFSNGLTQGVFQFESPGMKKMLKSFRPENFEDIILLVAAYRPGPLSFIPDIIASKWYKKDPEHYREIISSIYPEKDYPRLYHGENGGPLPSISLKNDILDEILKPTYGCPIYQEQVMQIFQKMGGYSLGRSDEVRRAMSKKKVEKLEHERHNFIYGNAEEIKEAKEKGLPIPAEIPGCCKLHGIKPEEANTLFDQLMPFAQYGFNKSHAAAYAVIAVITAWLKEYKTAEFYRSALNAEKIAAYEEYIKEFPAMNLKLLPPSLSSKDTEFAIENGNIRYPIAKTKGFSKQDYNYIPASDLLSFIYKNPTVSQAVLKKLIKIGCFDSCWNYKNPEKKVKEKNRVNNNKEVLLDFQRKYYKDIVKYAKLTQDLKNENLSDSVREKIEKEKKELINKFDTNQKNDSENGPIQKSLDTYVKEKEWEYDLLGIHFDDTKEITNQLIEKYHPKKYQQFSNYQKYQKPMFHIPVAVVNIGEQRETKQGNTKYYPVTLMDYSGNVINGRMKEKPISQFMTCIIPSNLNFYITVDQNDDKSLQNDSDKKDQTIQDKLNEYKNGNNFVFEKKDPMSKYIEKECICEKEEQLELE